MLIDRVKLFIAAVGADIKALQSALNGKLGSTATAAAATKLATARTINGVSFNGTANIVVVDATKLPLAGGELAGKVVTVGATTAGAGLNIPHGAVPSTPVNGDLWTTATAMFLRLNGTTRTMVHTATWSTVTQAEAEAGTASTVRNWTALRIRQAIAAYAAPKDGPLNMAWTTTTRPDPPEGRLGFNLTTGLIEYHDGVRWSYFQPHQPVFGFSEMGDPGAAPFG